MTRRRQLSDEDRSLWTGVTRSIKPLRPAKSGAAPVTESSAPADSAAPPRVKAQHKSPPPVKSLPLAPFDRRLKHRLARGRDGIDARIDLHGLTQREAHDALHSFLRRAQADGAKIALVVTGKGLRQDSSGGGSSARGVLRRQVPMWLSLPEFRPFIVGFEEAHVGHGGQGALYVRLRRAR